MSSSQFRRAWGKRSILPKKEQQSRGKELLQILKDQKQAQDTCRAAGNSLEESAPEGVDVEVIVKHTFIEVVDPTLKLKTRSMSDAGLFLSSGCERSWENAKPWQKSDTIQDLSDVSTEDFDACSRETSYREETGSIDSSDGDAPVESLAFASLPYQYPDYAAWDPDCTWDWMPMGYESYDAEAMMCGQMVHADGNYTSMQWMPTVEVCAEQMTWTEPVVETKPTQQEWRTTVMLRNMPNNYTREMLLELVDSMGFVGTYDFAYLPIDFSSQAGLGYAFINFISAKHAERCFDTFEGFSDWKVPSEKVCTVTWSSPYQGLDSHIERYQNSPVMHHTITDDWKPILLRQGVRVPFPLPTKTIKTPKIRQPPASPTALQ
jgi:hypothetical protein